MPDDLTGTHSLPPSYFVSDGDTVLPIQHNPPFEDVSQGLSNRLHKDGRTAWTGKQNANGNQITNLADGSSPQNAATVRQAEGNVGDFKETIRDLSGGNWLRRDGSAYNTADYPVLSAMLPPATDVTYTDIVAGETTFISARRVNATNLILVGGTTGPVAGQVYTASDASSSITARTLPGFVINYTVDKANGAFGNGIFAVNGRNGNNHTIWTASNIAGPWTQQATFATNGTCGPMAYHDGYFYVMHLPVGSPAEIWRTTDGVSWTKVFTAPAGGYVDLQSNGTEIVGLGSSGTVIRSTNGTVWTTHSIPAKTGSLAWSTTAGVWAAASTEAPIIYTSATGQVWSGKDVEAIFGTVGRAMVGNYRDGLIAVSILSPFNTAALSPDGVNFYPVDGPFGASAPRAIAQNAQNNPEFVVARQAGEISIGFVATLAGQFRVPADDPIYGWIKAKESS